MRRVGGGIEDRKLLVGLLALGLALTFGLARFCASAEAEIVVGQSIAGVQLGESESQVRATLGKPFRVEPEFSVFPKPCLCTVSFKRHRATAIDAFSKSQRTEKGITVGSSFEETTEAYPEARCHHPKVYGKTSQYCVLLSTDSKGRIVKTTFAFFEKALGVRDIEIRLR